MPTCDIHKCVFDLLDHANKQYLNFSVVETTSGNLSTLHEDGLERGYPCLPSDIQGCVGKLLYSLLGHANKQ